MAVKYDKILDALREDDLWWVVSSSFKWYFATQATLETAYPTATNGDYAIVWSTDTIWVWDGDTSAWKNSSVSLAWLVPDTRTITINWTALDLSVDRSWTITSWWATLEARTSDYAADAWNSGKMWMITWWSAPVVKSVIQTTASASPEVTDIVSWSWVWTFPATSKTWQIIQTSQTLAFVKATKSWSCNATTCYIIANDWTTVLSQVNFVWNIATFNYNLPAWTYYIACDSQWATYDQYYWDSSGYPQTKTNITYMSADPWNTSQILNFTWWFTTHIPWGTVYNIQQFSLAPKEIRIRIPWELIADTSNYQWVFWKNNTWSDITITNVWFYVWAAASWTWAAAAFNVYKSSGTNSDWINTNATNLFTSAVDLTNTYSSTSNTPNTITVESGRWVSLRVTSSAWSVNKAQDLECIITYN